eukprot:gene11358-17768_t
MVKIVSWNIGMCGLASCVRDKHASLDKFLGQLDADIVCFQETKVSKSELSLSSDLALAPGWQSFFAAIGYSVVTLAWPTFCRLSACPIAAEEGLTGVLGLQPVEAPRAPQFMDPLCTSVQRMCLGPRNCWNPCVHLYSGCTSGPPITGPPVYICTADVLQASNLWIPCVHLYSRCASGPPIAGSPVYICIGDVPQAPQLLAPCVHLHSRCTKDPFIAGPPVYICSADVPRAPQLLDPLCTSA